MASFVTHLYGAALVSSVAALGLHSAGLAGPQQTQTFFFLGVAGGLLPDIDSDASKPVRGFFSLLAVALAFFVAFALVGRMPLLDVSLIWLATFLSVRFGVFEAFARFTVHRGVWHSWLAAALAALATANAAHHLVGTPAREAWIAGGFVALGYLTHLCLDELASVDLWGHRVRRSFGTALKPCSLAAPGASLAMLAAALALGFTSPSIQPALEVGHAYGWDSRALQARAMDASVWFAGLLERFN
jgi:hypothetical protein